VTSVKETRAKSRKRKLQKAERGTGGSRRKAGELRAMEGRTGTETGRGGVAGVGGGGGVDKKIH